MGPVLIKSPSFSKKWYESLLLIYSSIFNPSFCALLTVVPSASAPAASVGPSVPSVPTLAATIDVPSQEKLNNAIAKNNTEILKTFVADPQKIMNGDPVEIVSVFFPFGKV